MNHRSVQRTLFRMQLDPGFAERLRSGADAADGLGAGELALLRAADPAALSADREGRRREQFLRNVSAEFALSCAAGLDAEGFTSSFEFHAAVQRDQSLPLAFAGYAMRCSDGGPLVLCGLVRLERALARARRAARAGSAPGRGELALAPWAWLVSLPAGTLDLATRWRAALDAGTSPPAASLPADRAEDVLVLASRCAPPFGLREVEVEGISRELAELLDRASTPMPPTELARACGLDESELAELVAELLRDGVLVEGTTG